MVVKFTDRFREVRLVKGEALFNVAKNRMRPFVVVAGDTRVRAVGTSFSVRFLLKSPIRILVQEGVVEVTRTGNSGAKSVLAVADTQTLIAPSTPIAMRHVTYTQIARNVAWQYGQISFDDETLRDAAQEFARYSTTRLVVDPAVADRTVTGLFPADNPAGFAKAAASALNLRVESGDGEIRIIR
jgi:transmembrane sensor